MNRLFEVHLPLEQAYVRHALFAIELLDAVTLTRVSRGIKVVAEGLRGKPTLNAGGLFVWHKEPIEPLQKVRVDPGTLPFETVEREKALLKLPPERVPLTTIELPPRLDYAFASGVTGARGTLIESRTGPRVPVVAAEVRLLWLDDDDVTWRPAPIISHTTADGDFVSALRLAPTELPQVTDGALTVRLWARREGAIERRSADFKLLQGRVADPLTLSELKFAWDELQS
jgi:hypothetical protein